MATRKIVIVSEAKDLTFTLRGIDVDQLIEAQFQSEQAKEKKEDSQNSRDSRGSEPHRPEYRPSGNLESHKGDGPQKASFIAKNATGSKGVEMKKKVVVKQMNTANMILDANNFRVRLLIRFNERLEISQHSSRNFGVKKGEYPESTSIPCDWCRLKFDTPPLGIPISYRKEKREQTESKARLGPIVPGKIQSQGSSEQKDSEACSKPGMVKIPPEKEDPDSTYRPTLGLGASGLGDVSRDVDPREERVMESDKKAGAVGIYFCVGNFCSFECPFRVLMEDSRLPLGYRNILYKNSEKLLKDLFMKLFPGKVLKPAADWELLKVFGGELTEEEYRSFSSSNFIRTANIKIAVVGTVHEQRR